MAALAAAALVGVLGCVPRAFNRGGRHAAPPGRRVWSGAGALVEPLRRRWARAPAGAEVRDLIVVRTSLAGGATAAQAFQRVAAGDGPWAEPAAALGRRQERGLAFGDALDDWVQEDPGGAIALLADALALARATGGSEVAALDAVIETIRDRNSLAREVRALASQAQASALVMVVGPVAFAVALALIDPRVRSFYVGSPAGWACVVGGLALDGAGGWWMSRLVRAVR